MNLQRKIEGIAPAPVLTKLDPTTPAIKVADDGRIAIKAGTSFNSADFDRDTILDWPVGNPSAGADYVVIVSGGMPAISPTKGIPDQDFVLGGFHYAPGGNAAARNGGDETPAINPYSLWDRNFRPGCPDPRGMALIQMTFDRRFWCDIYLTGIDHEQGTSQFGATIADGDDLPCIPGETKRFKRFDYEAASQVMAYHGKGLLSFEEFAAAAFGVTERTSQDDDPETTQLDAPRTSKFGLIQATGNMWVWGHDGDPDRPRASLFGGSWFYGQNAGSRCAYVAYCWPVYSYGDVGARGRSDHLRLD